MIAETGEEIYCSLMHLLLLHLHLHARTYCTGIMHIQHPTGCGVLKHYMKWPQSALEYLRV